MSAMGRIRSGVAGVILCVVTACSPDATSRAPLTEHRPGRATVAVKHLGENCATSGGSECLSGLCGHFAASPDEGYFCTRRCEGPDNCPRDWHCNQVHPSPRGRMCVPPAGWKDQVAVLASGQKE